MIDLEQITGFDWDEGNARKNQKHGVAQAEAEEVCLEATRYCPFHQALQGNVTETLTVIGADPAT